MNDFFKKHKAGFEEDTEIFFCKKINANLKQTRDHFYETIVDALKQIKQINSDMPVGLIRDIRINYREDAH